MTFVILIYSLIYQVKVYKTFGLSEGPLFFNNLCIALSCIMYIVNSSLYISYLIKYYENKKNQGQISYEYLQQI